MSPTLNTLKLINLGIDTYKEPVIYMHKDCPICKSEGFVAQARIRVTLNERSIIATLNMVEKNLLKKDEASLSRHAWILLNAKEGDRISLHHPKILESLSYIRSKIYGHELNSDKINHIIEDMLSGQLSDINIAMFIAASANDRLSKKEILALTKAMVDTGQRLEWSSNFVVDKHSIGGLPGNRTTPIVVSIIAAYGLMIPKTSSRAITSPAGTADTMEVFAPVDLTIQDMRKVVEKENGCIVWGGSMNLSPADDLLIRIERTIDLDSEGQMVASILSKKIAAGSSHVLIEMPVGTTAKVRSLEQAELIKALLQKISKAFSIHIKIVFTDGSQPVGRGIGPALEANDILAVLRNEKSAPQDLRDRALTLAGYILEFSANVSANQGKLLATKILTTGQAFKKFQAICHAQGGMRDIPKAQYTHLIESKKAGTLINIDNRYLSRAAKLAGAPKSKAAGVKLLTPLNTIISRSQPLFELHSETKSELNYALEFLKEGHEIFQIEASG